MQPMHNLQSSRQYSFFRSLRQWSQKSELRFQQVLGNLTTAQQTIERMSRALPAPEEVSAGAPALTELVAVAKEGLDPT